jgi:hypothetical protein
MFSTMAKVKPWRFWIPLIEQPLRYEIDGKTITVPMSRPAQNTQYVFGIDISNGSGASNSVLSVLDHYSNQIVAKFWDAFTSPEDLAEVAAFAGVWFGGVKLPFIIFEKNGPGVVFGRKLLKLGYPHIYFQRNETTTKPGAKDKKTPRWGWHSSNSRKEMLLGEYREALKNGQIINPCREALDECLDYVYNEQGQLEPGTYGEEEGGGSQLHGDHVIADATLVEGRRHLPKVLRMDDPTQNRLHGSFAARRRAYRGKLDDDRAAWSR